MLDSGAAPELSVISSTDKYFACEVQYYTFARPSNIQVLLPYCNLSWLKTFIMSLFCMLTTEHKSYSKHFEQ